MEQALASLRAFIDHVSPISDEEWALCRDRFTISQHPANTTLYHPGDRFEAMSFLLAGMARAYFIDASGREFNWSFHFSDPQAKAKHLFLVDYASFIKGEPSQFYFETLSDVSLLSISRQDLLKLYEQSHYWANVGRLISEQVYYFTHQRTFALLTMSAKERYQHFVNENGAMVEKLSQQNMAAYLGITPQSLSRLKKEL